MTRYLIAIASSLFLAAETPPQLIRAADLDVRPYLMHPARDERPMAARESDTATAVSIPMMPGRAAAPHAVEDSNHANIPRGTTPLVSNIAVDTGPQHYDRTQTAPQAPLVIAPRRVAALPSSTTLEPELISTARQADISNVFGWVLKLASWGVVGFCAVLFILLFPDFVRALDRLLETDTGSESPELDPDLNAWVGAVSDANATSDLSAADIRQQTEMMRAMKEALDAELASVRAAMKHARASAEQSEPGERKETS